MTGRKALWGVVKWLLVPAGLAALGYYVVGPRIGLTGGKVGLKAAIQEPASETPEQSDPQKPRFEPPNVIVTLARSNEAERPRTSRERRRPKRDEPAKPQRTETKPDETTDLGSVGGTEEPVPNETGDEASAPGIQGEGEGTSEP